MTTPFDYFETASDQALIDRHKAMNTPRCRDCNCILNAEEIKAMKDTDSICYHSLLAFGQCSACRIIETTAHPCGNCGIATVPPGRTLCLPCLEKMKG